MSMRVRAGRSGLLLLTALAPAASHLSAPALAAPSVGVRADCGSGFVELVNLRPEGGLDVDYRIVLAGYPDAAPECRAWKAAQIARGRKDGLASGPGESLRLSLAPDRARQCSR